MQLPPASLSPVLIRGAAQHFDTVLQTFGSLVLKPRRRQMTNGSSSMARCLSRLVSQSSALLCVILRLGSPLVLYSSLMGVVLRSTDTRT